MNDIVKVDNLDIGSGSYAEQFVKCVKLELGDVAQKFFTIGFRLYEAQNSGYYRDLGFENISDCAEHYFGFKKSTTYDLINIYCSFRSYLPGESRMKLPEKYSHFSQSQLSVMAQMRRINSTFVSACKPTDSVAKMKLAASYIKGHGKKYFYDRMLNYQFKSLDEFISNVEKHLRLSGQSSTQAADEAPQDTLIEGEFTDLTVDSEHSESVTSDDTVIENDSLSNDVSDEEVGTFLEVEVTAEQLIRDNLKTELSKIFSAPGISYIMRDSLSRKVEKMLADFYVVNKSSFKDAITAELGRFDYEITLCGRKQPLNVFIGLIVNHMSDILGKKVDENE